jgi:hypothetical protein
MHLLGRRFGLMIDHSGLKYLFDQPKLNTMQARWMALLGEFYFEIKHIKGKENRVVDALGRSMKVIHLVVVSTCESDIKERVRSAQEVDEFFKIVKACLEKEPIGMKYEGYQLLNDGLLTYKGRLYIPNCDDLKRFIMDELHKIPYIGHTGYRKIIIATKNLLYWPRMKNGIVEYLDKFLECQQFKAEKRHPVGLLQPYQF